MLSLVELSHRIQILPTIQILVVLLFLHTWDGLSWRKGEQLQMLRQDCDLTSKILSTKDALTLILR
jgi:hypothetical protein